MVSIKEAAPFKAKSRKTQMMNKLFVVITKKCVLKTIMIAQLTATWIILPHLLSIIVETTVCQKRTCKWLKRQFEDTKSTITPTMKMMDILTIQMILLHLLIYNQWGSTWELAPRLIHLQQLSNPIKGIFIWPKS